MAIDAKIIQEFKGYAKNDKGGFKDIISGFDALSLSKDEQNELLITREGADNNSVLDIVLSGVNDVPITVVLSRVTDIGALKYALKQEGGKLINDTKPETSRCVKTICFIVSKKIAGVDMNLVDQYLGTFALTDEVYESLKPVDNLVDIERIHDYIRLRDSDKLKNYVNSVIEDNGLTPVKFLKEYILTPGLQGKNAIENIIHLSGSKVMNPESAIPLKDAIGIFTANDHSAFYSTLIWAVTGNKEVNVLEKLLNVISTEDVGGGAEFNNLVVIAAKDADKTGEYEILDCLLQEIVNKRTTIKLDLDFIKINLKNQATIDFVNKFIGTTDTTPDPGEAIIEPDLGKIIITPDLDNITAITDLDKTTIEPDLGKFKQADEDYEFLNDKVERDEIEEVKVFIKAHSSNKEYVRNIISNKSPAGSGAIHSKSVVSDKSILYKVVEGRKLEILKELLKLDFEADIINDSKVLKLAAQLYSKSREQQEQQEYLEIIEHIATIDGVNIEEAKDIINDDSITKRFDLNSDQRFVKKIHFYIKDGNKDGLKNYLTTFSVFGQKQYLVDSLFNEDNALELAAGLDNDEILKFIVDVLRKDVNAFTWYFYGSGLGFVNALDWVVKTSESKVAEAVLKVSNGSDILADSSGVSVLKKALDKALKDSSNSEALEVLDKICYKMATEASTSVWGNERLKLVTIVTKHYESSPKHSANKSILKNSIDTFIAKHIDYAEFMNNKLANEYTTKLVDAMKDNNDLIFEEVYTDILDNQKSLQNRIFSMLYSDKLNLEILVNYMMSFKNIEAANEILEFINTELCSNMFKEGDNAAITLSTVIAGFIKNYKNYKDDAIEELDITIFINLVNKIEAVGLQINKVFDKVKNMSGKKLIIEFCELIEKNGNTTFTDQVKAAMGDSWELPNPPVQLGDATGSVMFVYNIAPIVGAAPDAEYKMTFINEHGKEDSLPDGIEFDSKAMMLKGAFLDEENRKESFLLTDGSTVTRYDITVKGVAETAPIFGLNHILKLNSDSACTVEQVKKAIADGANVNALYNLYPVLTAFINHLYTPATVKLDIVQLLVEKGSDINFKLYPTPFHYSVQNDENLEITKYLLDSGADLNIPDIGGRLPVKIAYASPQTKQLLKEKAYDNLKAELISAVIDWEAVGKAMQAGGFLKAIEKTDKDSIGKLLEHAKTNGNISEIIKNITPELTVDEKNSLTLITKAYKDDESYTILKIELSKAAIDWEEVGKAMKAGGFSKAIDNKDEWIIEKLYSYAEINDELQKLIESICMTLSPYQASTWVDITNKIAAEKSKKEAEEAAEKARVAEDARKAKEAEDARLAKEAEDARKAKEAEDARKAKEAEDARKAKEAEDARKAKEAEDARKAKEAEDARKAKEAEDARLAKEAEDARLAKEAEDARLAKEAEDARLAKEAEDARKAKEAEDARLAKEAEDARLAKEAEDARLAKEAEDARKAKEAEDAENAKKLADPIVLDATGTNLKYESMIFDTEGIDRGDNEYEMNFYNKTTGKEEKLPDYINFDPEEMILSLTATAAEEMLFVLKSGKDIVAYYTIEIEEGSFGNNIDDDYIDPDYGFVNLFTGWYVENEKLVHTDDIGNKIINAESVRALIDNEAIIEAVDTGGHTVLELLISNTELSVEDKKEILEILIDAGADVNYGLDSTPLECANDLGNDDIINLLVAHGAE